MDIDGTTILVTGGAGMIGSATVDLLLRDHPGTRIVILDDLSRGTTANIESALQHPRVRFVLGDICDAATVGNACRNVDAVIHLAALRITACAAVVAGLLATRIKLRKAGRTTGACAYP